MNPFIKSNRKLWLNSWRFHVSVRVRKGRERARVHMRKVDGGILKQKVNSQMPFKQNGKKRPNPPQEREHTGADTAVTDSLFLSQQINQQGWDAMRHRSSCLWSPNQVQEPWGLGDPLIHLSIQKNTICISQRYNLNLWQTSYKC